MAKSYGYKFTAKNTDGVPLAFGLVYTYTAGGTSTEKTTYSDMELTVPNTNPVQLDAAGQAHIYLDGTTSFVIKTSAGASVTSNDSVGGEESSSFGSIVLTGDATVNGNLIVGSDVDIDDQLYVSGVLSVTGNVTVTDAVYVSMGDLTCGATLASNYLRLSTYHTFSTAIASSAATNNSLFLDSSDSIIKFKDSGGVVRSLY